MRRLLGLGLIFLVFAAIGSFVQWVPRELVKNSFWLFFPTELAFLACATFVVLFGFFMIFASDEKWKGSSHPKKKGA